MLSVGPKQGSGVRGGVGGGGRGGGRGGGEEGGENVGEGGMNQKEDVEEELEFNQQ